MTARKDGIACSNCPFFDTEGHFSMAHPKRGGHTDYYGTCRFNAPIVNEVMGLNSVGEFPYIAEDQWCARHPRIIEITLRRPFATRVVFGRPVHEKAPSQT